MNHDTVAHRWANDNYTSKGELNGPRMFAEQSSRAIYSHGRHFCIARKTGNPEVPILFTYRSYSDSTSKHISLVRRAISGETWKRVFFCHDPAGSPSTVLHYEWSALQMDSLPALVTLTRETATMKARIATRAAKGLPESATLTERLETLEGRTAEKQVEIRARALELERFARAFDVNVKRDCPSTYVIAKGFLKSADLMTLSDSLEKQAAKAAKAREKAQAAAQLKARADALEYLNDWKTDHTMRTPYYGREYPCYLRVKGGEVETSQGASVPVKHALRLYALASKCRDAGKVWESPPEKAFAVGHYTLTSISATGDVVIGCHSLTWDEMTRVYPACVAIQPVGPLVID